MGKKTRKVLFIVAGLAVFMLSACSGSSETTESTSEIEICDTEEMVGYTTYSDILENFQFQYPQDWTQEENVEGSQIMILSPLQYEDDLEMEGLHVTVDSLSSQGINEDLTEEEITEIIDLTIEEIDDMFDEFMLESRTKTKLSGIDAEKLAYTVELEGVESYMTQIIAVSPRLSKVYVLTFSNFEEGPEFDEWNNIFDKIIDSFCFEDGILD